MNRKFPWIIASFFAVLLGSAAMRSSAAEAVTTDSSYVTSSGQVVHCVSTVTGRTYCGTAKTQYVITGTPDSRCIEGQTWGLDDRGVWVSNGCVADFSPAITSTTVTSTAAGGTSTDYVTNSGQVIHCVSTDSGRTYCGTAQTHYVISGTPDPRCIEGRTWGLDDRGVWVSSGCVADFSPTPVITSAPVVTTDQVIRCDSTGDGRTYCSTETKRHYLLKKIREGNCVEGKTWGIDEHGLWVSGGCRGDFDD